MFQEMDLEDELPASDNFLPEQMEQVPVEVENLPQPDEDDIRDETQGLETAAVVSTFLFTNISSLYSQICSLSKHFLISFII